MTDRHSQTAENQELIKMLHAVVWAETQKALDKMDTELIKVCVDLLIKYENLEPLSPQQLKQAQDDLIKIAKEKDKPRLALCKRKSLKTILIAACCAVLLLVAALVSVSVGKDTWSKLSEFGNRIVELLVGEEAEDNGVTIIQNGEFESYDSLDQFLNNNDLNILYPTVFPSGIELTNIQVFNSSKIETENSSKILFFTNSKDIAFYIYADFDSSKDIVKNAFGTKKIINDYTCYILEDGIIQYDFVFNNYLYTVNASSHEEAIEIINNLKEFKADE